MEWRNQVLLVWTVGFAAVFAVLLLAIQAPIVVAVALALVGAWVIGELVAARAQARMYPTFKTERRRR